MLVGGTIFVGDSITVGYAPFVQTSPKVQISKGGLGSSAILDLVKNAPLPSTLPANMVVLGGTNDIGNDARSIQSVFAALQAIWNIGKTHGLKVIALTVPPARGFSGFTSNFDHINERRHQLNSLIQASPIPDQVIDLDALIGDPSDREKLAASFDSGDHLHPNAQRFATVLTPILGTFKSPLRNLSGISPTVASNIGGLKATAKLAGEAVVVGGVAWGAWRIGKSWGWW